MADYDVLLDDMPPTPRELYIIFDLTHCAFTIAEGPGPGRVVLYRCTLHGPGHQGDHHRVGDRHMEEVPRSWADYLDWKEAWLVGDKGEWLSPKRSSST